ncbi:MAG: (2Fe-2S)-binding protein [Proteobacteria bacterium]|nr:(2Fe-2S)-binding protein [Pseudomonadota bacterium]
MFRRMPGVRRETVQLTIDGRTVAACTGDTVAAAMFANGLETCRTSPVSGAARAPYCMMGVCFECLVVIDGVGNRQGCLVTVVDGMRVESQQGARAATSEIAADTTAA